MMTNYRVAISDETFTRWDRVLRARSCGMSFAEIGRWEGITRQAAYARYLRARDFETLKRSPFRKQLPCAHRDIPRVRLAAFQLLDGLRGESAVRLMVDETGVLPSGRRIGA